MTQDPKIYDFDQPMDRVPWEAVKTHPLTPDHEGCLPAWIADMDFPSPQGVTDALVERMRFPNYGYTRTPERLYRAYQSWLDRRHDWQVPLEALVSTSGILHQMKFIYQTFAQEGDQVVLLTPLYPPFKAQLEAVGGESLSCPLILTSEGYQIDWELLESYLQRPNVPLLYFCNPHNPSGRVWTKEELQRVGDLCLKHEVLIFSDDVHMDLTFPSHPYRSLASVSPAISEITMTAVAPNKSFNIAGFGGAMLVVTNPDLRQQVEDFVETYRYNTLSIGSITAATAAYETGEEWLDQVLDYIQGNMIYVRDFVAKHMPKVQVVPSDGTYLLWLDFRQLGLSDQELDDLLVKKAKVWLNSGHTYGPEGSGFMRLNVATQGQTLKEIMHRMREALDQIESI